MDVATTHAVGAEHAGTLGEDVVGGGDEAGVAEGAEVLGGVEGEGGGVAEGTGGGRAPACAEGLGGVFNKEEVVLAGERGEGVEVGALAVEMDGQDGAGACVGRGLGEGMSDGFGRQVIGYRVDVGEERLCAAAEDGAGGGEEAEGGSEDGVAGADVEGGHGEPERVGAAAAADTEGSSAGGCGALLEALDLRTEDELLRLADEGDGIHHLLANGGELTAKIEHLNRRRCGGGHVFDGKRRLRWCSGTRRRGAVCGNGFGLVW